MVILSNFNLSLKPDFLIFHRSSENFEIFLIYGNYLVNEKCRD